VYGEPVEDAVFVFDGVGGVGGGVLGGGRLPKLDGGIRFGERLRVAWRKIGVGVSVDEQHGRMRERRGVERRGDCEIDVVAETRVEKAELDGRAKDGAAEPRAGVELLSNAVVARFTKCEKDDSATTAQ